MGYLEHQGHPDGTGGPDLEDDVAQVLVEEWERHQQASRLPYVVSESAGSNATERLLATSRPPQSSLILTAQSPWYQNLMGLSICAYLSHHSPRGRLLEVVD